MTWVKICGLRSAEDVSWAISCGADAVGFVQEPTSKRYVDALTATKLAARVPSDRLSVAVYGPLHGGEVFPDTTCVQSIDIEKVGKSDRVLIQTIRPLSSDGALEIAEGVWAVLLDTPSEDRWGGTGELLDLQVAESFCRRCPLPVILAGGLDPSNVQAVIRKVRPFGVDVSSGVESSPGVKDREKIRQFIEEAKNA